jgi:type IV pilus assembly protein PilQ
MRSIFNTKIILHPILSLLLLTPLFAIAFSPAEKPLTIDLQNVNLPAALRIMAKFLNRSLIVSPTVTGMVSLHLHNASANQAFDLLLSSQNLAKSLTGTVWFVEPQTEFVKHKQAESKLSEELNDITPLVTQIWSVQYAKAEDIAHLLQDNNASLFSKHGHVSVDARTNMLCVQDLPERLASIHDLIKKLDIPVQQVLIEARLASVDSDYERDLGVDFSVKAAVDSNAISGALGMANSARFSLAVARLADGSLLDVALSALEKAGKGELLSSPSLFTANQKTASIEAGEEIPYQEVSRSGGTGVAFKKAVLSLRVTPQIMPGNKVMLQLQINQDKPSKRMVLGVPAISTRQISTNILVNNGQTLVLGGIYERSQEYDEQRVPFLGKIPLVGLLFQQQNVIENKRELLIFVTPKIIAQ